MLTWHDIKHCWWMPLVMFAFTLWLIGTGYDDYLVLWDSSIGTEPHPYPAGEVVKEVKRGEIVSGKFINNGDWKRVRNPDGWMFSWGLTRVYHSRQWVLGLGLILLPLMQLYIGICALYRIARGENQ